MTLKETLSMVAEHIQEEHPGAQLYWAEGTQYGEKAEVAEDFTWRFCFSDGLNGAILVENNIGQIQRIPNLPGLRAMDVAQLEIDLVDAIHAVGDEIHPYRVNLAPLEADAQSSPAFQLVYPAETVTIDGVTGEIRD